ncbi:biotin--acetyl-CoA-carboxylase ligase [Thioclava dalianensis]|uniref:biotin--[biotin carboxyl-carrier protein] ligase n=1 Tax=Thioclava dalianensis TaxID=1185766 RepID=A0A074TH43_9RHOB|nr:biotin--[acetyl-CoA-carboxylase] ligase [Thioclava dalianensis]KEP71031.1 biotin--acetyl-CoA-carboxylase ligase [Thioclava dalianensis]
MATWPEGVARHVLASVDSTMNEAARLAPGLSGSAWIFAHEQTAARGRRGRAWRAPQGNFAATLVMRPKGGLAHAALYSFVAALALEAALSHAAGPHARLAIKWPNDVLLSGGKIAGILLESLTPDGSQLAIGIGVNLAEVPARDTLEATAMAPVSLLGETGMRVAPQDFLPMLAQAFDHYDSQFRDYGFEAIRNAWLARAARLGETITARTGRETHTGVFETIDATGALVLRDGQGRRAISAAEIFF